MGAELASIRIIDRTRAPTLQIAAIFTNLVANSIDESDSRQKHLTARRADDARARAARTEAHARRRPRRERA